MASSSGGAAAFLVESMARLTCSVSPGPIAALEVRLFLARCMRRGRRMLACSGSLTRVLADAAAPFSTVTLLVGGRVIVLELVPFAVWFRGSALSRVLSRRQLADISGRFTQKSGLSVVLPSGFSLPVGATPGAVVEVSGAVLEWLIERLEYSAYGGFYRRD